MNEDSIKATPQSPGMGMFANGLTNVHNFLSGNGMGMLSDLVGLPSAASLATDMSYGSPPYKGSGMATRIDPRVLEAAGGMASTASLYPRAAATAIGMGGAALQVNQTLDSVIQEMLNKLGEQTRNKR